MKLVSKQTLLAAVLAAASVGAFAADSVDLKIIGTIVPPSCTPTLSGGGVVDFGNIPAASLSQTSLNKLGTKTVTLNLACDEPTVVAVKAVDGRTGSAVAGAAQYSDGYTFSDAMGFGLGMVGGKKVGTYTLTSSATVGYADGKSTPHASSNDGGSTWDASSGVTHYAMKADGSRIQAWGSPTPGAYKSISQMFNVTAVVDKAANLPALNQVVPLDGLATFSLVYL
ncbi:DUF1120 domain-containing protein [Paraburkholderia saeva]|uniref:Protein GltF n=1 Tax=Paraburkholderia saeva TaxID=2777537 RepID=A0A9N8RZS7_9BURK|nr:DUF1120 domain-containing protein [Paraburkholderia saeva]CAG4903746.1 Protein GltF [Paraburkholderia saeva]CAG4905591.1 Protein GltF [Paraburkholderia saeva]CAG4909509.1 Protein GltF [Paraburkholderia saeva]